MPDIVLVQPPNPVLFDPTTRWPLGLAYLEAVLLKQGYKVAVADLRDKGEDVDLIPPAPVIGFTATTGEIESAKRMATMVKERDPSTWTEIGGAHATHLPEDCLSYFDVVVAGEGEDAMLSFGGKRNGAIGIPVPDLDTLPFPARHPFSFSATLFQGAGYGKGPKATSIITARGCPFTCAFCQTEARPVRFRSPENVVEEIQRVQRDWDCHHFRFEDDTFTLKHDRVLAICRLLEPLNIHWRCHTRSAVFSVDLAKAMKAGGCVEVGFGVESADDQVLAIVNKRERVDEHVRAIAMCNEAGMVSKAFFITGLPRETDGILGLTRAFLERAQPTKVILSRFTPYPGSDVWAHPEKYGVKWIDPDFSHFWNFPSRTTVTYEDASAEVLERRYRTLLDLLWSSEWRRR